MMFCQLGYIRFERTEYFSGIEGEQGYGFAEHARIAGKPKLQGVGDDLATRTLDMRLDRAWCDPQTTLDKLKEVSGRKEAMALTFGDGTYAGRFVVTRIVETDGQRAHDGTLQMVDLRLSLKEWVDDEPLVTVQRQKQAQAPARKVAGAKAPASVKKGTPPFTKPTTTSKAEVSVKNIVRQE